MTYGTIKVDTVTFTDAGVDKSVTLSGLVQNPTFSGNVTVTGTLSGVTVTGTTANFTSGNFTNISGGTHTITSGVFAAGSAASPSITFTGDLNTGIYSPGADQVAISTGGSGRLFVDASGRVGVGTSSPTRAFDVAGGVHIGTGTNDAVIGYDEFSAGVFGLGTASTVPLVLGTTSLERLRITSAGLVGVGTSSPSYLLDVAGSARIKTGATGTPFVVSTGGDSQGSLRFGSSSFFYGIYGGPDYLSLQFHTGGSERLRIDSSGLVGIGTSSPSVKLEVSGPTSSNPEIRVVDGTVNTQWYASNNGECIFGTFSNHPQVFRTNGSERLRITSAGLVGIGTSAPQTQLHVNGGYDGSVTNRLTFSTTFDGNANSGSGIYFKNYYNNARITAFSNPASGQGGTLQLQTYNSDVSLNTGIVLDNAGRVGIGTTSPDVRLHVATGDATGYIKIDGGTSSSATTGLQFRAGSNTYSAEVSSYQGNLQFITGANERARIDSSGRLLVGTSTARSNFFNGSVSAIQQIEGANSTDQRMVAQIYGSAAGDSAAYIFAKHRSTSIGGNTIVSNNDTLGLITFQGSDGAEFVPAAYIFAEVDGTPGANDMPGRLVFSTTADGASSPTERLYLYSNGYVRAPGVYALTTAVAADVRVDSDGYLYRSTSSIRYKKDVETLQDEYADAILNARPVWFRSLSEKDNPDWGYWGFIAEEVEQIDPRLCTYGEDEEGNQRVESVQYDRFVPHLLNLIKRQQQAIETLEAKVAALESV